MDESSYFEHAKKAFARIENAFDDVDVSVVDCERTSGDVLTLTFPNRVKCVLNTQRPTRQIWLAARAEAWHFAYDEASGRWLDPRRGDVELFDTLRTILAANAPAAIEL